MAWQDLTQREKVAMIRKIYGLTATVTADAGDYSFGLFFFDDPLAASKALTKLATANPTGTVKPTSAGEIVAFFKARPVLTTTAAVVR